ncbi:hypothetical protein [Bacillus sp. AFS017336]|nr:hypothetical protein [Bacillus sp. AFS017336]
MMDYEKRTEVYALIEYLRVLVEVEKSGKVKVFDEMRNTIAKLERSLND